MPVENLALALSSSMTAGINLYLTVLGLGLMQRFEIVALPDGLEWLSNPGVMVVAGGLFVVEFFADKFPVVDSMWDAIHTFIRVPAGGFLAAGAADGAMAEPLVWMAGLGGSAVSLVSHGTKASTRTALNTSPEPFSNGIVSTLEDLFSAFVLWLAVVHPIVAIAVVVVTLVCFAVLLVALYRFLLKALRRIGGWFRRTHPVDTGSAEADP